MTDQESLNPAIEPEPKKIIFNPDVQKPMTSNEPADGPSLTKNLISVIVVTFFLLFAFVGAYLLKGYYVASSI